VDFNFTTISIPFLANQTHTLNVSIINDGLSEEVEAFLCVLTIDGHHSNMVLENPTMEIAILDDGEHIQV
jgi:hypothetical protein